MKESKPNFWIPDNEVEKLDRTLRGRSRPHAVIHTEHGAKLCKDLDRIRLSLEENIADDSLAETDLYIFKVELPEGEKIQNKTKVFSDNGIKINIVKNEKTAIVSTSHITFQKLKERVTKYTETGSYKTSFDFIDAFAPYTGREKNSRKLQLAVIADPKPETLDIQLMFIPNLQADEYTIALEKLMNKIRRLNGEIKGQTLFLSDHTPVVRAAIPANTLPNYENDNAIYRIEETHFFRQEHNVNPSFPLQDLAISQNSDLSLLPIVAVLDSGVHFPSNLSSLIVEHWLPPDMPSGGDEEHGTSVAGCVAFGYLDRQLATAPIIFPRARIADCVIMGDDNSESNIIRRIQQAVAHFKNRVKIYNFSNNLSEPIAGDEMSILGYELDRLQQKERIQFVISAGNHYLWQTAQTLEEILADDDTRIAAPADSMLGMIVGAVAGSSEAGYISLRNQLTPYSRKGPGFAGFTKPDIVAYAANIDAHEHVLADEFSKVITRTEEIADKPGTSFAAPIVAGALAELLVSQADNDILVAKALMLHHAKALWDSDNVSDDLQLNAMHNLYGKGLLADLEECSSNDSKVIFIRKGTLNRRTKAHIKIYMPDILAAKAGRNTARVSITCISLPSVDRTKGTDYVKAYIQVSLRKIGLHGNLLPVSPPYKEGRRKWDTCCQFSKIFSDFQSGDWEIRLEMSSRWDNGDDELPYALIVTIEDLSRTLDIYSEIEALNRYQIKQPARVRIS